MSNVQQYNQKYYKDDKKLREQFKYEGVENETFTQFKKRIRESNRLDVNSLKVAIKKTPAKMKNGDIFDWITKLLGNYSHIRRKAKLA